MPTNKKEGIIFTTLMCFSMVFVMSIYNLILHGSFSFISLITGLIPGFIVAFILDVFVVGVLAKKIVFNASFINNESKIQNILAISGIMVLCMVTCMSLFGIIMENGISDNMLNDYLMAWRMNVILALPLQFLIVGPFSRYVLGRIQNKN